jgi:hypothetical protein
MKKFKQSFAKVVLVVIVLVAAISLCMPNRTSEPTQQLPAPEHELFFQQLEIVMDSLSPKLDSVLQNLSTELQDLQKFIGKH